MTAVFIQILNTSISACYLVIAILLLRLALPKLPKWSYCLLWGIVALRLFLPFSLESSLSLLPSAHVIPEDITQAATPAIYSGIPAVNSVVNPALTQQVMHDKSSLEDLTTILSRVWLVGVAGMLLYFVISILVLRMRLCASMELQKGVRLCDNIRSPFVFGLFLPTVYLPSGISEDEIGYVLAHEQAHIQRKDHWWKPLGFLLLTVHWFNPLLWVGYCFLCRDIERACDEKVITKMDSAGKVGYANALLACSVHRRMILACPVAFGEVDVKSRIRAILQYRKATIWTLAVAMVACAAAAVCFLTDPVSCQHAYTGQVTLASTCTEYGLQTLTCSHCRHCYAQPVDPTAHTYGQETVVQKATCTCTGTAQAQCVDCGALQHRELAVVAHTAAEPFGRKEADCTHLGQETATCEACQTVFVTRTLPTNDVHAWTEKLVQHAGCTEPGQGIRTCTRCGVEETCVYPALGHNLVREKTFEGTCYFPEEFKIYCRSCDYLAFERGSTRSHSFTYIGSGKKQCIYCGWYTSSNGYTFGTAMGTTSAIPEVPIIQWDVRVTPTR